MDATRFAALLSFLILLAPLAGLAEDNAGTVAAKIVKIAKDLRKAGQEDEANKRLRDAAASCEDRLRQKPDDAQARFALAQLQVHLDQVDAAGRNLERAMQLEPNNEAMYAFKGRFHGVAKDYPEAIKAYRRSVELDPKNAETRTMLAMCLANANEKEEAVAQAREVLKLQPNEPAVIHFYALMLLQAGQYDEWERVVRSALDQHPKDVHLLEQLVLGFVAQQRFEKAYRACLEWQKLDPNNVEIEVKLIFFATQARQTVAAEQHLARVLEYRKAGKYDSDDVTRDQFYMGNRRVLVKESFDTKEESFSKFVFYVVDEQETEERRVQFTTSERYNEQLRRDTLLKETERAFALICKRGADVQYFGTFPQPTYDQARAMAIEVLEGTRLPKPWREQPAERQAAEPPRSGELQRK